jgi:hypothetical protein
MDNSSERDDPPSPTAETHNFVMRDKSTRVEKGRKELRRIADSILLTSSEIVKLIPTDGTQSQVCPSLISLGRLAVKNPFFCLQKDLIQSVKRWGHDIQRLKCDDMSLLSTKMSAIASSANELVGIPLQLSDDWMLS